MEVYTSQEPASTERAGPVSFRRQIEAVKNGVRIEQVAQDYGGAFRMVGSGRLLGRCLSPDHEDRTPSMTIFVEEQRFKCFGIGCGAHGDVIDLARLVEGGELWVAMVSLSIRYGVELPGRPESWYRKQDRQKPVRNELDRALFDHFRRRLFRRFFAPYVEAIEDRDEREAEAEHLWDAAETLTRLLAAKMMGVGR